MGGWLARIGFCLVLAGLAACGLKGEPIAPTPPQTQIAGGA